MAEWPRFTKYQREILMRFSEARYNDLHMAWRDYRTFSRLQYEGMIESGPSNWYRLTERGKDYVRFVLRAATREETT